MRALLLTCLLSVTAMAQVPLAVPQFADPPELNGAPATTYTRHVLWNSTLACLQRPVGASWQCFATEPQLDAEVDALNARIDSVQAQIPVISAEMVCGTASISGLSIPLTGISPSTSITASGATVGAPCVVGGSSFLPLGAYGVCVVSAPNTISLRFQGGGLLSSLISIPNGTYKACALVAP